MADVLKKMAEKQLMVSESAEHTPGVSAFHHYHHHHDHRHPDRDHCHPHHLLGPGLETQGGSLPAFPFA